VSRYEMSDGTVVDTDRAVASWDEDRYSDGHNRISKATGSQWDHESLYRTRKGRYYVEHYSQRQGSRDHAEWVSLESACRWLLANEHSPGDDDWPEDLTPLVEEVME
jgi:hypothetical protein